jgi:hypothetical protein
LHLIPEIEIPGMLKRTGLYENLISLRERLHYKAKVVEPSIQDFIICQELAELYKAPGDKKAPFHLFAAFLSLRKRKLGSRYRDWVLKHYAGKNLDFKTEAGLLIESIAENVGKGIFSAMNKIADNIPEVQHCYELIKEASKILEMSSMSELETIRGRSNTNIRYKDDDEKMRGYAVMAFESRMNARWVLTKKLESCYGEDEKSLEARKRLARSVILSGMLSGAIFAQLFETEGIDDEEECREREAVLDGGEEVCPKRRKLKNYTVSAEGGRDKKTRKVSLMRKETREDLEEKTIKLHNRLAGQMRRSEWSRTVLKKQKRQFEKRKLSYINKYAVGANSAKHATATPNSANKDDQGIKT